jgi:hypothetical protein
LGDGWHTMRVAAIGDQVTIAIDGDEVILEHDSEVMTGNLVGIWSDGVGLEIRSVKVFEVAP